MARKIGVRLLCFYPIIFFSRRKARKAGMSGGWKVEGNGMPGTFPGAGGDSAAALQAYTFLAVHRLPKGFSLGRE